MARPETRHRFFRAVCAFFAAAALIRLLSFPAFASDRITVYYAGPDAPVLQALRLCADFTVTAEMSEADVLVLNGAVPGPEKVAASMARGKGLVLVMGPAVTARDLRILFGGRPSVTFTDGPASIDASKTAADDLIRQIAWNSAPQVRERTIAGGLPVTPVVMEYPAGNMVLGGRGNRFILTPRLTDSLNQQFQQWAYFNYLVYHLCARAAGRSPLAFHEYPGSPVPHAGDSVVLLSLMGLMTAASFILFAFVRRYSRRHPESLDIIVADTEKYAAREMGTGWEEVGFHRPLGGFMLALMLGIVVFIPLIVYQNLILPVYILPSAQALGIWGRVTQFFNVAWLLFDMGTSTAFIKFLSQYRVNDPRRGIQYGQLFIWWQILSGAIQAALIISLAGTLVPRSAYAVYAWSIVIHAVIQIPGFYQVMRHALTGLQRFDYAQILDIALAVILPIVVQPVIVGLMYLWGKGHPGFGAPMGGVLGLGIAAYAAEALTFLAGLWLYRRLGYGAKVLFLAHFDWEVIRTGFRFGMFEMLGSLAWAGGQAAEVWITQARLVNYAEIWGNWGIAQNFIYSYLVLWTLYTNLLPSISESISHGRRKLSQYYSAQAYKWGGLISAFLAAVLLAVADRFILGASGPEFVRAATYAVPLIIWGAMQFPSWVGDTVQLAANRPYLKTLLVLGEQVIRVALAWVLLDRLQIYALIVAYFVGLTIKNVAAYAINNRVCFPQRYYAWQSLAAPLLAGAAHFLVLRWLGGMLWHGDQVTSVLIFFIGILPSFPLFAFFYALFGGWDPETLREFRGSVDLSNFMRPFAWLFWAASELGASLSPLHGRFPIDIREAAVEEARELTRERVQL
jgi:O-antigen/teichoic acid export membrane protein